MRIGQRDAHGLVELLEAHPDACERAAGTYRAGEAVDAAFHLLPDLARGAFDVRAAVGDVVELVGPDRAFGLFRQAAAGMDEVAGVGELGRRDQDQFGAERAQRVHLLL